MMSHKIYGTCTSCKQRSYSLVNGVCVVCRCKGDAQAKERLEAIEKIKNPRAIEPLLSTAWQVVTNIAGEYPGHADLLEKRLKALNEEPTHDAR